MRRVQNMATGERRVSARLQSHRRQNQWSTDNWSVIAERLRIGYRPLSQSSRANWHSSHRYNFIQNDWLPTLRHLSVIQRHHAD